MGIPIGRSWGDSAPMSAPTKDDLFADLSTLLDREDLSDEVKSQISAIIARVPAQEVRPLIELSAFDQMMELNPYAMAILSGEGGWVRGNKAFVDLFGSIPPPEYSIFNDPFVLRAGIQDQYLKLKDGKTLVVPELWYDPHDFLPSRPSAPSCICVVMFPLMGPDGKLQQVVAMYENITARKQAEENLIRSERLAAAGTIASGVAHEFNNINALVVGFAELGLDNEPEGSRQREIFQKIIKAAVRGRGITRDLLTFAGQRQTGIKPAHLDKLVKDMLSLVEQEMKVEGIAVVPKLNPVTESVMSETEIGQVAINLLINAQHAVLNSPTKQITVETGSDDDQVWLVVRDTGVGVAVEDRHRIFTPFYSTKGEHAVADDKLAEVTGTGLGLSLSLSIARAHGGDLTMESTPGEGSTFTLRLPIRTATEPGLTAEAVQSAVPTEPASLRGVRVAIVDDEPDIRMLLTVQLEIEGGVVRETDNGQDVLGWIRDGEIDVVVTDLIMPKMTGHQMLQQLRKIPVQHRPACLIMAGLPSRVRSEDLEGLAAVQVLGKPFQRQELKQALLEILAARRS